MKHSQGTTEESPRVLLVGIGGVHNYGCEAIVRGTEAVLHSEWPNARIVYASCRPKDDRVRLKDCAVDIVRRKMIGHFSIKNIARKLLSCLGITWCPMRDSPASAEGYDAVLSIGGDIYTLNAAGGFNASLPKFGNAVEKRGIPYVLWGASVGPFSANPKAERFFSQHLKQASLITAREASTVDYLRTLGISDNVVPCADPAYTVAPEIRAPHVPQTDYPIIGVNLSPLSVTYAGTSRRRVVQSQARTIERLIETCHARVLLIPHVVCDFMEMDDDFRHLCRVKREIAPRHQDRVAILDRDIGFVDTKRQLVKCNLVIAARMHCAINAIAANVPTIFVAYSRKAIGMCGYIYGNHDWVLPLSEFAVEPVLERKVKSMLEQEATIRNHLSRRILEVRRDAYHPIPRLKRLLEG